MNYAPCQLKVFAKVVQTKSVTKASEELRYNYNRQTLLSFAFQCFNGILPLSLCFQRHIINPREFIF